MVVPYTPPPAESAEGLVTRLAGRMQGATGWMRFLGVVCVIGGALGALGHRPASHWPVRSSSSSRANWVRTSPPISQGSSSATSCRGPGLCRPLHLDWAWCSGRPPTESATPTDTGQSPSWSMASARFGSSSWYWASSPSSPWCWASSFRPLAQRGIDVHSQHRGHRRSGVTELSIRLRCHASTVLRPAESRQILRGRVGDVRFGR